VIVVLRNDDDELDAETVWSAKFRGLRLTRVCHHTRHHSIALIMPRQEEGILLTWYPRQILFSNVQQKNFNIRF
jgi:hypothetical protein